MNTEASRNRRDALDLLSQATGGTPEAYYEAATIHAWLAAHGTASSSEIQETDNQDERQRHADLAVQTLRQAIKLGWSDAVALRNDKLWDPFREREDFQKLKREIGSAQPTQHGPDETIPADINAIGDQKTIAKPHSGSRNKFSEDTRAKELLAAVNYSVGLIQADLKLNAEADASLP